MADRTFKIAILLGAVDKASSSFKSVGKAAAVMSAAVGAAMIYSVVQASAFEAQMANVNTMLDRQSSQFLPALSAQVLEMSKKYGEGTETLTTGLYNILSASVPVEKSIGVLDASVRAAAAGLTNTGVAADAITTILNSYQLSADQATSVSDLLFSTVKRGKTTFGELAPAIGMVASTASTAGLSVEEMGASIATMTRAGIDTRSAVTSLNQVMTAFLKPSEQAKKAAAALGIELSSTTIKNEGLIPTLEKLTGATDEQQTAIFGNVRAFRGVAAILQQTEGYYKDLNIMQNRSNATAEAYAKQTDTLSFKFKTLGTAINVIAIKAGEKFGDTVDNIIDRIIKILPRIEQWIEESKTLETIIYLIGETINFIIDIITELNMTVEIAISMYQSLIEKLNEVSLYATVAVTQIKNVFSKMFSFISKGNSEMVNELAAGIAKHVKEHQDSVLLKEEIDKKAYEERKKAALIHQKLLSDLLNEHKNEVTDTSNSTTAVQLSNYDKMKQGWKDAVTEMHAKTLTWKDVFLGIMKDIQSNLESSFATAFKNVGQEWKTFGDVVTTIGNAIRDAFISMAAKIAAEWVTKTIVMKGATLAWKAIEVSAAAAVAAGRAAAATAWSLWGAIAIGASIGAAVLSMARGFETGGIVGGNSFTGDKVPAKVNSGEMILTRGQQRKLFDIANGNNDPIMAGTRSGGGININFIIEGNTVVGSNGMEEFAQMIGDMIINDVKLEGSI